MLVALDSWATYEFTQAIFDDTLPVPDLAHLDVTIWQTGSLDLPDAEDMANPHLYREHSATARRASVAIYGMLVRLARVTFFTNTIPLRPDRPGRSRRRCSTPAPEPATRT